MQQDGLVAKLTQLLALYVVYVFLSGWAFFDHYYREFGADPRWFDLPLQETLVKGFTVLFTNGALLWVLYLALVLIPLLTDDPKLRDRMWVRVSTGVFMIVALVGIYFLSARAGASAAMEDKGTPTRLALSTFSWKPCLDRREAVEKQRNAASNIRADKKGKNSNAAMKESCDYSGQILIFRSGTYYMYKVAPLGEQAKATLELRVFRAEDLSDLRITGQP
jgi:hypothetical protein